MTLDDLAALEKNTTIGPWKVVPRDCEYWPEGTDWPNGDPVISIARAIERQDQDSDFLGADIFGPAEPGRAGFKVVDALFIAAMRNHAKALIEVARNVALAERLTTDGDARGGFNAYQDALSAVARLEGVGK